MSQLRAHGSSMGCSIVSEGRPHAYKQYDRSKLEKAVFAVSELGMSTRRAALEYDVPQSTLSDNVRGRVCFGVVSGRKKYLTDSEEEELVTFIIKSAEIGYGYTVKEIMSLVQETIEKKRDSGNCFTWLVGRFQVEAPNNSKTKA